jgi:16S rRNA (guanine527-N7)-methyltransferase
VPHLEILESELREFQLDLPSEQKLTLARFCDELVRWNRKINLTGGSGAGMVRRLVVEPVWISSQLKLSGALVDIGSGNGSPAIPLRVVSRLEKVHLVEVRAKRAAFLRHVVAQLHLDGAMVHRVRFEDVTLTLGRVDWITLQGVALGPKLIDSMRRMAATTTTVVWITSEGAGKTELPVVGSLEVPITHTKVLLLRLDQS